MPVATRLRATAALTVLTALACVLAACSNAASSSGDKTLLIGHIAQLTGAQGPAGSHYEAGIEAALAEVNDSGMLPDGWDAEVVAEDDGTDVAKSAQILSEMVSHDQVHAVLSSGWTPISVGLWPLVNDYEVPLITASSLGGKTFEEDYFFSLADLALPRGAGEHLVSQDVDRVGLVIDGDNPGFELVAGPIEKVLKESGGAGFATRQTVATSDTDFSSVITNLVNAEVDAVVLAVGADDVGNFMLQSQDVKALDGAVYVTHHAISTTVATVAEERATSLTFPQAWIVTNEAEALAFEEKSGTQANSYFAYGHDAVWLIAAAAALVIDDGDEISGKTLRAKISEASQSEKFVEHAYLDGLDVRPDGTTSVKAVLGTFDTNGRIVLAD
ncbi:ABC transporter substrate-binding protein [Rhodococcus opacus]